MSDSNNKNNNKKRVRFNKLVRSASGHVIPEKIISKWHADNPRVNNNIRLNHEGLPATQFGTSKTALGYPPDHYQTRDEKNRASFESRNGPDANPHRSSVRNTVHFANEIWELNGKTSDGAWFINKTFDTIFIAAAVLAAAGFAYCGTGTKRKGFKKGKKGKGTRRIK